MESSESLSRAPGASSLPEGTGRTRRSPPLMQHAVVLTISGRLIPDLSLLKSRITLGDFHPYTPGTTIWPSQETRPPNPATSPRESTASGSLAPSRAGNTLSILPPLPTSSFSAGGFGKAISSPKAANTSFKHPLHSEQQHCHAETTHLGHPRPAPARREWFLGHLSSGTSQTLCPSRPLAPHGLSALTQRAEQPRGPAKPTLPPHPSSC